MITDDVFAIPELTRAMRSFASPHALGESHDRFFSPLLDARRNARAATRWNARVSAFDADRLEATMRAIMGTLASELHPHAAPDRRALTARIEDACAELFNALDRLRVAQTAVGDAPDDTLRAAAWSSWIGALRHVFSAADRGWERVAPMLNETESSAKTPDRRARKRKKR